jgi:type VII secretion-associated serine protease mycosin
VVAATAVALVAIVATTPSASATPAAPTRPSAPQVRLGAAAKPLGRKTAPVPEVDPDHVVVRFRPGVTSAARGAATGRAGGGAATSIAGTDYELVDTRGTDPKSVAATLGADPAVATAEPNYIRRAADVPTDPYYAPYEAAYMNTLRFPAAWSVSHGSAAITVAVVDTGVDFNTPDLAGRLLTGYDFVNGDATAADDEGHGTEVAGIIAAVPNNGKGLAGAAFDTRILPVKVLDSDGSGTDVDIAAGIRWAADHGARIINLSLGGPGDSALIHDAVKYAAGKDVVVVAAAGNEGGPFTFYPAAYDEVLSVTATDANGTFAWFSNSGPWVDLAAPGMAILSTYLDHTAAESYVTDYGTSFAAPLVSGAAVLAMATHPGLHQAQIRDWLKATASDRGPDGIDDEYGFGLLDAYAAVDGAPQPPAAVPPGDSYEPNDAPSRATAMTISASSTIGPEGDIDWYSVTAPLTGALTVVAMPPVFDSVTPQTGEMDAAVEVFDASLNLLDAADAGVAGEAETAFAPVESGQPYYVAVRNFNGAQSKAAYSLITTFSASISAAFHLVELRQPAGGTGRPSLGVGDVTGDGRADVVATILSYTHPQLLVYPQLDGGFLGEPTITDLPYEPEDLAVGDLNGDGVDDVAFVTRHVLDVRFGGADGLGPPTAVELAAKDSGASRVVLADVDGDGRLDMVTIAKQLSVVHNGASGFTVQPIGPAAWNVQVGDLTGDGRPDIVTTGSVSGGPTAAQLWTQGTDGTFTEAELPFGLFVYTTTIGDVDGDGRADLITNTNDGPRLYPQMPGGGLASPIALHGGGQAFILDADSDGLNDIEFVTQGIGIVRQVAPGSFGPEEFVDLGRTFSPFRSAAGDFDSDGRTDIALADIRSIGLLRQRHVDPSARALAWSTSPADFAAGLGYRTAPAVTSAVDLDPASVNTTTTRLVDGVNGAVVPAAVGYASKKITITPSAPLRAGSPYIVELSGIADAAGNVLVDGHEFRFTTTPNAWYPFATATALVQQQYRDFLGREGDPGGVAYWANLLAAGTVTPAGVARSFMTSPEFASVVAPVTRLYLAYFLRSPDYAGLQYWVGLHRAGTPLAGISDAFAGSAEFVGVYGHLTNAEFVELVYNNVLGRPADAAGKAYWLGKLNSGQLSRGGVMLAFSESPEFVTTNSARVLVTLAYVGMLRRAPDADGLAYWIGVLQAGGSIETLIGGFFQSPEYASRFL